MASAGKWLHMQGHAALLTPQAVGTHTETHTAIWKSHVDKKFAGIEWNRKKLAVNPLKLNTADGVDVDASDKEQQQHKQHSIRTH